MNNTESMQNLENIIQTVLLNDEEFSCLEHFLDVKADVIVVEGKKAFNDLIFCFDRKDKETFLDTIPDYVRFVKNNDNQFICKAKDDIMKG